MVWIEPSGERIDHLLGFWTEGLDHPEIVTWHGEGGVFIEKSKGHVKG